MTSAQPIRRLGDLADVAVLGQRLRQQSGKDDPIAATIVSGADLAAGRGPAEVPGPAVPILVGSRESLPWAGAVAALATGTDACEFVPDCFDGHGRLDHPAWSALCEQMRDIAVAMRARTHPSRKLPDDIDIDNAELRACANYLMGAADRGQIVLLDGPTPAAAALLARAWDPAGADQASPMQAGATQIERKAWDELGRAPVLPWHTRLNDGSLAPLAIATLELAATLLNAAGQP